MNALGQDGGMRVSVSSHRDSQLAAKGGKQAILWTSVLSRCADFKLLEKLSKEQTLNLGTN